MSYQTVSLIFINFDFFRCHDETMFSDIAQLLVELVSSYKAVLGKIVLQHYHLRFSRTYTFETKCREKTNLHTIEAGLKTKPKHSTESLLHLKLRTASIL